MSDDDDGDEEDDDEASEFDDERDFVEPFTVPFDRVWTILTSLVAGACWKRRKKMWRRR